MSGMLQLPGKPHGCQHTYSHKSRCCLPMGACEQLLNNWQEVHTSLGPGHLDVLAAAVVKAPHTWWSSATSGVVMFWSATL